jgi:hypothetical protein
MVNVKKDSEESMEVSLDCTDELRQLIGDEVFLLSSPIARYNKYGWRNTRLLVLTQDSISIIK